MREARAFRARPLALLNVDTEFVIGQPDAEILTAPIANLAARQRMELEQDQ